MRDEVGLRATSGSDLHAGPAGIVVNYGHNAWIENQGQEKWPHVPH